MSATWLQLISFYHIFVREFSLVYVVELVLLKIYWRSFTLQTSHNTTLFLLSSTQINYSVVEVIPIGIHWCRISIYLNWCFKEKLLKACAVNFNVISYIAYVFSLRGEQVNVCLEVNSRTSLSVWTSRNSVQLLISGVIIWIRRYNRLEYGGQSY